MASSSELLAAPPPSRTTPADIAHSAPTLAGTDRAAVLACLERGWIAQGAATMEFAEALRQHGDATRAAVTASGTSGLAVALHALDIGPGDEVIVPTYVCGSVLAAVRSVGAIPVLCDIGEHWRVQASTVARVQTARTRAIVAVSIFGLAWDIDALAHLGLPIIDDRCQAFGLPRPDHALVAYSVCSFHATKCLTTGEGGAVLAWSNDAAHRLDRIMATHRRMLGVFSDLQAALGLAQLAEWSERQQRRRDIAARYLQALPTARTTAVRHAAAHGSVWFRFPVTLPSGLTFDTARTRFAEHGVQVRRGVDTLLHRVHNLPDRDFPNAVAAFDHTLSIPIWPGMSDEQVDRVVEASAHVLA